MKNNFIIDLFGGTQTMRHKTKTNAYYKYKEIKFTEIMVNFFQEN